MYQGLVFLACLAVGFGAKNTTISLTVTPTATAISPNLTQTSTLVPTNTSASSQIVSSTTSMPTPTPTATLTPTSNTTAPNLTTTTPKPTSKPTSAPTTKPKPTNGDYSIKGKVNGTYCLLAKLAVSFNISYNQNKTEKKGNKTSYITVKTFVSFGMPFDNFSTNGSVCASDNSTLQVSWPGKKPLYTFKMSFGRTKDKQNVSSGWDVTAVSLDVSTKDNPLFENATEPSLMFSGNTTDLKDLSGGVNGSYKCKAVKDYPFDKMMGTMMVKYAQLQPFDVPSAKGKEQFGAENNCKKTPKPKPPPSNIVPIAVGCALAGLVLIVLIAYIIGRRKSQRGYEKV